MAVNTAKIPQDLTGLSTGIAKVTTGTGLISTAINSDLPVGTATVGGAVPTPPNNTTTFLRGDMTFAAPSSASVPNWVSEGTLSFAAETGSKSLSLVNTGKSLYMLMVTGAPAGAGVALGLQFNSDTAGHYSYRRVASASVVNSTAATSIIFNNNGPTTGQAPILAIIYFPGVATNSLIPVTINAGMSVSTDEQIIGGQWNTASNPTSVTVVNTSGTAVTLTGHLYSLTI